MRSKCFGFGLFIGVSVFAMLGACAKNDEGLGSPVSVVKVSDLIAQAMISPGTRELPTGEISKELQLDGLESLVVYAERKYTITLSPKNGYDIIPENGSQDLDMTKGEKTTKPFQVFPKNDKTRVHTFTIALDYRNPNDVRTFLSALDVEGGTVPKGYDSLLDSASTTEMKAKPLLIDMNPGAKSIQLKPTYKHNYRDDTHAGGPIKLTKSLQTISFSVVASHDEEPISLATIYIKLQAKVD